MALTDVVIKKAPVRETRYLICDGDGLNLEIMPSGAKNWRLRYRENGHEHRVNLGKYPTLSLADARSKRDELKKDGSESPAMG